MREVSGRHSSTPGPLQLMQGEPPAAALHNYGNIANANDRAGFRANLVSIIGWSDRFRFLEFSEDACGRPPHATRSVFCRRREHPQLFTVQPGFSDGPRVEGSHLSLDLDR